jgi:hypothetical protein
VIIKEIRIIKNFFFFFKERGEWNALIEGEDEEADVTCEP